MYRLTAAGFDQYHDLERWVTYRFIEPLWAEMTPARGHNAEPPRREMSDVHAPL